MSKAIKVDDQVYQELDQLRVKGETFSQVIAVLLQTRLSILEVMNVLEGTLKFRRWQEERLEEIKRDNRSGARL